MKEDKHWLYHHLGRFWDASPNVKRFCYMRQNHVMLSLLLQYSTVSCIAILLKSSCYGDLAMVAGFSGLTTQTFLWILWFHLDRCGYGLTHVLSSLVCLKNPLHFFKNWVIKSQTSLSYVDHHSLVYVLSTFSDGTDWCFCCKCYF